MVVVGGGDGGGLSAVAAASLLNTLILAQNVLTSNSSAGSPVQCLWKRWTNPLNSSVQYIIIMNCLCCSSFNVCFLVISPSLIL